MLIGGLQKFTLLDYPGKIAAVVFTLGCNFRCGFCHNPELVNSDPSTPLRTGLRIMNSELLEEDVLKFLNSRQGLLEGVVITGGEPTLQADLPEFIRKVKKMGFLVKVDTNGAHPEMIERLNQEKLVDYWAMDIKAPLAKYQEAVGSPVDLLAIKRSIELIKKGRDVPPGRLYPYEFRSTLVAGLHTPEDVVEMAKEIAGAELFVLQRFVSREKLVNQDFVGRESLPDEEMKRLARECEKWVKKCVVRY